jgi:hypothetical protein
MSTQRNGNGNAGQGVAVERDDDIEEDYDYTYGYGENGYENDDYPAYDYADTANMMKTVIITVKVATTMETALVMKPLNQNSERSSNSPLIYTRENTTMKLNKS